MEKAYDLKALGEMVVAEAKKDGIEVAEVACEKLAKAVYVGLRKWASESATLSENKVDDICAPFYQMLDSFVLPQIEKIDLDGDGK